MSTVREPFGTLVCNKMYCWINIRHTLIVKAKVVSTTEHAVYTPWTMQWLFPFCATLLLTEATSCIYQDQRQVGLWERISSLTTHERTE